MKELIKPEIVEKSELDNFYSPSITHHKSNLRPSFNVNQLRKIAPDSKINLTQNNIDNRKEIKIHNETVTNNTTINNEILQPGGFLRFFFILLTFPFKIIKSLLKWIFFDSGFYENFKADQEKRKFNARNRKIVEKYERIYASRDEVY